MRRACCRRSRRLTIRPVAVHDDALGFGAAEIDTDTHGEETGTPLGSVGHYIRYNIHSSTVQAPVRSNVCDYVFANRVANPIRQLLLIAAAAIATAVISEARWRHSRCSVLALTRDKAILRIDGTRRVLVAGEQQSRRA